MTMAVLYSLEAPANKSSSHLMKIDKYLMNLLITNFKELMNEVYGIKKYLDLHLFTKLKWGRFKMGKIIYPN